MRVVIFFVVLIAFAFPLTQLHAFHIVEHSPTGCVNGFEVVSEGVKVPCSDDFDSGAAGKKTFGTFVTFLINTALIIVGGITVLFLMIGGFRYVTANGNEEQLDAAKSMIKNSIIGLVVVVLSFAIVTIITNFLVAGFV